MAYIYRLIFLFCIPSLSFAVPLSSFFVATSLWTNPAVQMGPLSASGLCAAAAAADTAFVVNSGLSATILKSSTNQVCTLLRSNGGVLYLSIYQSSSCPSGTVLTGSECVSSGSGSGTTPTPTPTTPIPPPFSCPAGSALNGSNGSGICVCSDPSETLIRRGSSLICMRKNDVCQSIAQVDNSTLGLGPEEVQVSGRPESGSLFCQPVLSFGIDQGCTGLLDVDIRFKVDGQWVSRGTLNTSSTRQGFTSSFCTAAEAARDPTAPKIADPVVCKGGQAGEVNGKSVCIPFLPSTVTDSNNDIKKETVDVNGNPSTVEKSVNTVCQNSVCTTTTITNTSVTSIVNGSTQTATTTESTTNSQTKADYCAQNSKRTECGQSGDGGSSFGGSCDAGFKCDGDGLMCSIALEQHQMNCKIYSEDKDANSQYNKAISGTDLLGTDELKKNAATVNIQAFNVSGSGYSRSCPADPVINLNFGRSKTFTIPFSKICTPLSVFSLAGVGITLLGSMLWVLGSGNKS